MTFAEAIASGFRNYATFAGRAARSEYWYWTLFVCLVSAATLILDMALFPNAKEWPLNSVWGIAVFLPGLGMSIRRLHDIDRTGWWLLLAFTIIGVVLLIVWACMRGTKGRNRFGPDPLAKRKAAAKPQPASIKRTASSRSKT
jgi:uncharacterized membrane protein YhaH (DUF805 family)